MQNQRIFWLTTLAITGLGFGTIYWYNQTPVDATSNPVTNKTTRITTTHLDNKNNKDAAMPTSNIPANTAKSPAETIDSELQTRIDAIKKRRPNLQYTPEQIAAASARSTSWSPSEEPPANLPLLPDELTDGRQFIQLDTLKMETLMPGDAINVRVAENARDYQVVIDKVEKHDYNSISWYGHIQGDDGQKYSVSFTRGETLTVGGLDTPDGHYVLQAHGNNGWIASSQLLFKVDPHVSDAIHPADVDPSYAQTPDNHSH